MVKVKDWDIGPMVDDPLGMTSVDLANLGLQGEVADGWMELNTTEVNKGQVKLVVFLKKIIGFCDCFFSTDSAETSMAALHLPGKEMWT